MSRGKGPSERQDEESTGEACTCAQRSLQPVGISAWGLGSADAFVLLVHLDEGTYVVYLIVLQM